MKEKAPQTATLLENLKILAPESSANTLRSWIEKGRVSVNGRVVERSNQAITLGQEITIGPSINFIYGGIKVLFEDESFVVIEKPHGLLSVATNFHKGFTAHDILKKRPHAQRVFPVHRLDRDTSGVMIFAYNETVRDHFKTQFEKRVVEKVYYAVVEGKILEKRGTWQSYLKEDEAYFVKSTGFQSEGKLAISHFEVVAQTNRNTLLRLRLQTGRKNQLRVHCSEQGFPIVGDKKYGAKTNPLKRMALHSQKISFDHPVTEKRMSFETFIPESFNKLLNLK